jgi:hypothetical protein
MITIKDVRLFEGLTNEKKISVSAPDSTCDNFIRYICGMFEYGHDRYPFGILQSVDEFAYSQSININGSEEGIELAIISFVRRQIALVSDSDYAGQCIIKLVNR